MKKSKAQFLRATAAALFLTGLFSSAIATTRADDGAPFPAEESEDDAISQGGFHQPWLFGGVDVGPAWLSAPANSGGEADKTGIQLGVKGLFSYYWPRYTVDLGLGWNYSRLSSDTPAVKVITKSGYAEAAGRYRFNDHWSLGPLVNFLYGTDTSFSEQVSADRDQFSVHGGLQGFYEMPLQTWLVRFGLRATTDLDIADRQFYVLQGALQIGFPLKLGTPPRPSESAYVSEPAPDIQVSLDLERIHFDTAKAEIGGAVARALENFGTFLSSNDGAWGVLRIDGHTDERGSFGYNLNLSYQRARRVRAAIVRGGAAPDKVLARGFSFTQPVIQGQSEAAWSKNRRVELRFYEVRQPAKIREGLDRLQKELDSTR